MLPVLSSECLLVQFGMVHNVLHPQHHLFYQAGQVLQENEGIGFL